jgi:magnesium transporter
VDRIARTGHVSAEGRAAAIPAARSRHRGRDHAHQRPKIEQYGEGLFIVARTAQLDGDNIAFGETHLFVGEGYLVSVRHGASTSYTPVRERCESCPRALARGEDYILYAILDFIVDNYSPVLETIHEEVEAMEQQVLASAMTRAQIERLYLLRRDLLRLRNAVGPLVESLPPART